MPRGVPKNGYPKNRKSREQTPELRLAISEGVKRRWQDPEYRKANVEGHYGIAPGGKPAVGRFISAQGYVGLTMHYDHPLANDGTVLEHRKVLYDKIGPGSHDCNWCGKSLEWGGLEGIQADHKDGDKQNNDSDNLVPSCLICNRKGMRLRG